MVAGVRKIAADFNVVLDNVEFAALIAGCNGSIRNVLHNTVRLARRKQAASG